MQISYPEYLKKRATGRRESSPCGIGAVFEDEITESDLDGRRFNVIVTDTMNGFERIEILAPRVPHDAEIEETEIEEFVEREAGRFPIETRMRDLVAASPLRIELFLSPN